MFYYKDHSDAWLESNGRGIYAISFPILLSYNMVYLLPLFIELQYSNFTIITVGGLFLLAIIMFMQMVACRRYLRGAVMARYGEQCFNSRDLQRLDKMLYWALFTDSAVCLICAGVGFKDFDLWLCINLSILSVIVLGTLILAIVGTARMKNKTKDKEDKTNEEEQ